MQIGRKVIETFLMNMVMEIKNLKDMEKTPWVKHVSLLGNGLNKF
jgi:hypothetical protein